MLRVRWPTLCMGLTVMPGESMGTSQVVMVWLGLRSVFVKSRAMQSIYFALSASVQKVLWPLMMTFPRRSYRMRGYV